MVQVSATSFNMHYVKLKWYIQDFMFGKLLSTLEKSIFYTKINLKKIGTQKYPISFVKEKWKKTR